MRRLLFFLLLGILGTVQAKPQNEVSADSSAKAAGSAVADTLQDGLVAPADSVPVDSLSADTLSWTWDPSLFEVADTIVYTGFPRVSLLTCSAAPEVWQQYGHTALRYEDPSESIDVVFNYGLFSFGEPHFIWRFCTGQTDYIVGAEEYASFESEYLERGSSISIQMLNMTPSEVARFWSLITENCRPANRVYRYNFLYKNCSTMARDIVLQSLSDELVPPADDSLTFRQILHEFNGSYPWSSFGIDLLLGYEVDRPVDNASEEFAPAYLMRHWAQSQRNIVSYSFPSDSLQRESTLQPWVKAQATLSPVNPLKKPFRFPLSPLQMMILVLLLTAVICTLELLTEHVHWWYDFLLYGMQGVAGIVITFLFFFSSHPAVDTNMLVILFNPLILILLPLMVTRTVKRRKTYTVCLIELGLIVALVAAVFITKQAVPLALWVFVGALLFRTVHHIILRNYLYDRFLKKKLKA